MNDQDSYPHFTISPGESKILTFSKLNLDSINHEENPCIDQDSKSGRMCKIEKAEKKFLSENNCILPWMMDKDFKICPITENINETHSIFIGHRATKWEEDILWNVEDQDCPDIPKCKRSLYKVDIKEESRENNSNHASVIIKLESSNVQNIVDTIAYDLQSLIGEVGGTLGLFLGLSTYSFVELIEYLMNKLFK